MNDTLKILLAYDGGDFKGFAPNPGVLTIGGKLKEALERVLGQEVSLVCAGRTDAGVHAWGQVVSVHPKEPLDIDDLGELETSLRSLCAPAILIRKVSWAEEDFEARRSAKSRLYYYHISNRIDTSPLLRRHCWQIASPLNLKAMKKPVRQLLGEKNFGAFCRKPIDKDKSLRRNVLRAGWRFPEKFNPSWLQFYIEANAFCHQMVRSIVGTLVEMGRGNLHPDEMEEIIESEDRSRAGPPAPPNGLILQKVAY